MITVDIQQSNAGVIVELYQLDLNPIGVPDIYYFHNGVSQTGTDVVFAGQLYTRYPIETDGFERTGNGQQPRPTLRAANIDGVLGQLSRGNADLVRAKLTRIRTFLKYLDAVNFVSQVNPTADPLAVLDVSLWFIDRKASENKVFIEWELTSALDLEGAQLPKRQCIQNVCTWVYRSPECSYAGPPVADAADQLTDDPALDRCGKRLGSCRLRFVELPFGGYPGISAL